ncbi:endoplasmic reticulum vesicle transporter-domain-containing protein [Gorgonomyces haynaldii]|nr:endoplasmic reticulum vesicle transporter-domain-containing protein [Gorgonomyces haynaldii]
MRSRKSILSFKQLDAYAKPMEDFRIQTMTGASITLVSSIMIVFLVLSQFADWIHITQVPSLSVDTSRKDKMKINLDIVFPKAPCFLLTLDVMDVSGEHQNDVEHSMHKTRLDANGRVIDKQLIEIGEQFKNSTSGECGDCYGARPGCCNTCEEVRVAYQEQGWSFDVESVAQCVKEGYTKRMKEQEHEGCQIHGYAQINKVQGNLHIAPGKSFNQQGMHIHDLSDYRRPEHKWDFTHTIKQLSFGDGQITNPLTGTVKRANTKFMLYQYYIKVVGTEFVNLDQSKLSSNQYAVTEHERDVSPSYGSMPTSMPGIFFNFEISPMLITYKQERKPFSHFLTDLCAIIGGVYTVAGMVDQVLFTASRRLQKKQQLGKQI